MHSPFIQSTGGLTVDTSTRKVLPLDQHPALSARPAKVVNLALHRITVGAPVPDDSKPFANPEPERDWTAIGKAAGLIVGLER